MAKTYFLSPFGAARHPWLNKPDTKYNADGLFKVELEIGPSKEADDWAEGIQAEAQKAFDELSQELTVADRKKYTLYVPVERAVDDQGNETGAWLAHFKQNALIKLRDGTEKAVKIGIKDASGTKDVRKPVFGGSEIRIMYCPRAVKVASARQIGVRLDFASVQVRKLNSGGGGGTFGSVEGYEELDERDQANFDPSDDKPIHGDY